MEQALALAWEILNMEEKFRKNRHGPLGEEIEKKKKELRHRLESHFSKKDPQQALFEAS